MNKKALIKISIFCLFLAVALSLTSLLFMNRFASLQGSRFREDFLRFYSTALEQKIHNLSLDEIKAQKNLLEVEPDFRGPLPPPPPGGEMMGPPPPFPPPPPFGDNRPPHGPRPPMHLDIWLMTEKGEVLLSRSKPGYAPDWGALPHPKERKEFISDESFFRLSDSIVVGRLNTELPLYIVVKEPPHPAMGPMIVTQGIMTLAMIIIALVLAMASVFYYLRKKSKEARSVLLRLEQGDLQARFTIHRLDEFGGLMLDFNRMAEEIESLVNRIHATEKTRKQLLQEMSHDLRTPLTSLKTSFETLQTHFDKISEEQRKNLFASLVREIDYFKNLIEQLMTIASLDEPHFKASTQKVNLLELLKQEVSHKRNSGGSICWNLEAKADAPVRHCEILGDPHLLSRMLRNGLENAERYAHSEVQVAINPSEHTVEIEIYDDGPGLEEEALKNFGQRREFRGRKITKEGHLSLGLGSVIMKTIAELHKGTVAIENIQQNGQIKGAVLRFHFPSES